MCYRTKSAWVDEIANYYRMLRKQIWGNDTNTMSKEQNGFDHPKLHIITNFERDRVQGYTWGLKPVWAKDNNIMRSTLNAKIETLSEKPSFRDCIKNRCLVIVDGFYEWRWEDSKGKKKTKYFIQSSSEELMAFAGLYEPTSETFTIVTTEAQGIMREIHNTKLRQPVILNREAQEFWLTGEESDAFQKLNVPIKADVEGLTPLPDLTLF